MVEAIFPYFELGKNLRLIDHRDASGRAAETSEWMQAGTVASRNSKGLDGNARHPNRWCLVCRASGRYGTSSGRMEQWTDGRPDWMTRHPDGWQGTEIFWLVSSAESSDITLNSGIPDKSIYTYKWFCQPECSQSKPNILEIITREIFLLRWSNWPTR
jgi:hypothetical protein